MSIKANSWVRHPWPLITCDNDINIELLYMEQLLYLCQKLMGEGADPIRLDLLPGVIILC